MYSMKTSTHPCIKNHSTKFCPIDSSLKVIGNKWSLLLIRDLSGGTRRFGELQRSLTGISPRTLSLRLEELRQADIISRKVYDEMPPKVEYQLTRKGRDLLPVLKDLYDWGKKHRP